MNGELHTVAAEADTPLLYALRNDLGLTAAKLGCGLEQCGACTVLIDGEPAFACTTAVRDALGREIVTLEGLASGSRLHPVQAAFLAENAAQCGYCTAGMVVAAVALLERTPEPSDAEIRAGLAKHLCRCGVYPRVVRAVRRAAAASRG